MLAKLSALTHNVMMVTKTFLDSTVTDVNLNYTLYRLDRNHHGGGVLITVLKNLIQLPALNMTELVLNSYGFRYMLGRIQ